MKGKVTIPVTAIIPTRNRRESLDRTLESLGDQSHLPKEIIVVDASADATSKQITERYALSWAPLCRVRWLAADTVGAAAQRNQGVATATQPLIGFFDDDILFRDECISRLWRALESDSALGGVSAMIINQRFQTPGLLSRTFFTLMNGHGAVSFAGRIIGPAINLLPEDCPQLPEVVSVEWLNLGATIYRREALPNPPFDRSFVGYSLLEDVALSLQVAKRWRLANARTARIIHDSQPGEHKENVSAVAEMELVNRHYVMTKILNRRRATDYLRLIAYEGFGLLTSLRSKTARSTAAQNLKGKVRGISTILHERRRIAPSR